MFPVSPEDPFQDLFDRRVAERLGPYIGRNVLDPTNEYDPVMGLSFLAQNLRDAHSEKNPFLSSPGDLKDAGFIDNPYVIRV
jgi:hypothetical protein